MAKSPVRSSLDFTRQMRKATRDIHEISDHLVNAKLAFALSDSSVWADGLLVFYEVFKFLEHAVSHPMLDSNLRRTEAFEKDLAHYLGPNWKDTYKPRESVVKYIQHLEELAANNSILLLAYVYHLYMGLLSGGQIIRKKRLVSFLPRRVSSREAIGESVTDFKGLNLYNLKRKLRDYMEEEAAKLDDNTKQLLIDESKLVFVLNNEIIRSVHGAGMVLVKKLLKLSAVIAFISVAVCYLYYN